jgi:hypothetical protein
MPFETQARFEVTCKDVWLASTERHDIVLRITDPPSREFLRYIHGRRDQIGSVVFTYQGDDALLVAAQCGTALAGARHLTALASYTQDDASWTLAQFLEYTCSIHDTPFPPLDTMFLSRACNVSRLDFLQGFSPTLKNLTLCLRDEDHSDAFFSLELPHLEYLSLTGDCASTFCRPPAPLELPRLRSLVIHTIAFTATPFCTGPALKDLALVSTFFLTPEGAYKHTLQPRRRLTLFWCDIPDSNCVDVSKVTTAEIVLGKDTYGQRRSVPSNVRFSSLRSLPLCDLNLLDLHPFQIPLIDLRAAASSEDSREENEPWPPRS